MAVNRKRPKVEYTILPEVHKAIIEATKILGCKSASRFVEETMREKSTAVISKHAQDQSLEKSSKQ